MGKIYAVKAGRKTGLFYSWSECEAQVKGYPGAKFKSFSTMHEAQAYLSDAPDNMNEALANPQNKAIAYVDGSYDPSSKRYGSGAVLFYGENRFTYSKAGEDPELVEMRNVAGELFAAMAVMNYCVTNAIPELDLYYDYEGICAWAKREWKANKKGTLAYQSYYREISSKLKVHFIKVKAHSGDRYNEEADRLAKEAIGL